MGSESSVTSFPNKQQIKALPLSFPSDLQNPQSTQIYQVYSHSHEYHQAILNKIRAKKAYNSPFITRILDSHTIQSINMCSTIIKTYVVIEKPHCLSDEIQFRSQKGMKFEQKQICTILYSCLQGTLYLLQKGVLMSQINRSNIFIDVKGNIKISDPELTPVFIARPQNNQQQIIHDLLKVVKNIQLQQLYSLKMQYILQQMENSKKNIEQLIQLIQLQQFSYAPVSIISLNKKKFSSQNQKINLTIKNLTNLSISTQNTQNEKISIQDQTKFKSQSKDKRKALTVLSSKKKSAIKKLNPHPQNKDKKLAMTSSINSFNVFDKENFFEQKNENSKQTTEHCFPKKTALTRRKKRQSVNDPLLNIELQIDEKGVKQKSSSNMIEQQNGEWRIKGLPPNIELGKDRKERRQRSSGKMISFQVDEQTAVCQLSSEHSEYFMELMNQRMKSENQL